MHTKQTTRWFAKHSNKKRKTQFNHTQERSHLYENTILMRWRYQFHIFWGLYITFASPSILNCLSAITFFNRFFFTLSGVTRTYGRRQDLPLDGSRVHGRAPFEHFWVWCLQIHDSSQHCNHSDVLVYFK